MEFCKKCGGLLVPKKSKNGVVYVCRMCGKKAQEGSKIKLVDTVEKKEDIIKVDKENKNLPTTENICSKCRNKEAYWWIQQTRSIDEPPTRFYKCVKCGYTWREYS